MPDTAPITQANPSVEEMEARVARFRDLKPTDDYVDSGVPGCERTTLRVLGREPHAPLATEGFHMSIVHCEPGKSAPLHNHLAMASGKDPGMINWPDQVKAAALAVGIALPCPIPRARVEPA